jgi:hypothetical protein
MIEEVDRQFDLGFFSNLYSLDKKPYTVRVNGSEFVDLFRKLSETAQPFTTGPHGPAYKVDILSPELEFVVGQSIELGPDGTYLVRFDNVTPSVVETTTFCKREAGLPCPSIGCTPGLSS